MAPLARHRHAAATHRLQVAADDARVQRRGLDFTVAAVLLELAEVARVGLHRVVAQSAFDSQAVEMALDDAVPVVTQAILTRPVLTRPILTWVPPGTPVTELGFHAAPLWVGTASSRSTSAARKRRIASSSTTFPPLESLM